MLIVLPDVMYFEIQFGYLPTLNDFNNYMANQILVTNEILSIETRCNGLLGHSQFQKVKKIIILIVPHDVMYFGILFGYFPPLNDFNNPMTDQILVTNEIFRTETRCNGSSGLRHLLERCDSLCTIITLVSKLSLETVGEAVELPRHVICACQWYI